MKKQKLFIFLFLLCIIQVNRLIAQNTILGQDAGTYSIGSDNVFIGSWAGSDSDGTENVYVGLAAGNGNNGSFNTVLGAENYSLTGSNAIVIGSFNYGVNVDDQLFIGYSNIPLIWGDFNTKSITLGRISSTSLSTKITTSSGYLEIGPQTTSYAHIYTDRPSYYFNKRLVVDEGIIASFNENLVFKTDISETRMTINNSTGNVGIGTTSPISKIHSIATSDGNEWNEAGLAIQFSSLVDNSSESAITFGTSTSNAYGFRIGSHRSTNGNGDFFIDYHTNSQIGVRRFTIDQSGNVGIGSTSTFGYRLAVNGTIGAKEVVVETTSAWPDYVFAPDYQLKSLKEVEYFIKENQHLPDVPSAKKIAEEGISLGEMNTLLLQKIEELTLYMIELEKKTEKQQTEIEELKSNKK